MAKARSSAPSIHFFTDWSLLAAAIFTRRRSSGSTSTDSLTRAIRSPTVRLCLCANLALTLAHRVPSRSARAVYVGGQIGAAGRIGGRPNRLGAEKPGPATAGRAGLLVGITFWRKL